MFFTVIGNPENRRVGLFRDAVEARGGAITVLPWLEFLRDPDIELADGFVRIESPGENWEVESALLGREEPHDRGRIRGLEQSTRRMNEALESIAGARCMNSPASIAAMFDKVESKRRLSAVGVDVPRTFGVIRSFAELRDVVREAGRDRFFVKPRHGSSASGVIALSMRGDKVHAVTSVERVDDRLYNSLRLSRHTTLDDVARIVDLLGAEDQLLVEEWVPKASTQGHTFDLRIVAIGACAEHVVVRLSKSPMTNLHLGNQRGDADELRESLGERWRDVIDISVRAVSAFEGALYGGVDIALTPDHRRTAVFEVNAFGDLLPGVVDARGRDCYAAEVDAFMARSRT